MAEWISSIEEGAHKATGLQAFPVNLTEIRRNVKLLLSEVGRYGFFDEYTAHSFSHVEEMLKISEWIIPTDSRQNLTPADCFMLTMSIYFHDLGLLITRKEFSNRNKRAIELWAKENLFKGEDGQDYGSRLNDLSVEERERFIYQEYVRAHHGSRVKSWIDGSANSSGAESIEVLQEIQNLIRDLPPIVKRDIAKLCESHNLDDIEDITKYPLSQPYGNSRNEEADLQYIAVILRTADLLQITNSRAPSTLFRIISPSNPASQTEWHKQNAVRRIREKEIASQEGRANAQSVSDTIEVFADFSHAEGFFGLTSYLRYAESQLQKSHHIIEKSTKQHGGKKAFPWRRIDDRNVEAEGFIPKTFGFEIDQSRILTLLTGHTLYNDSTVVIRELVQNSIDAVRLQWRNNDVKKNGKISIRWNSKNSELTIEDNGTGMTQEVVEQHLLKVGSSRYQDPKFRKSFPDFNSISRFGIGVLTAFMVADSVEIVTVCDEEESARQISLRTVHGKYLIRLLEKSSLHSETINGHGTSITLRLRPSAKSVDVLATVQRWIMFPGCRVEVAIDNEDLVTVGFDGPADALGEYLKSDKGKRLIGRREFKVISKCVDGIEFAYAVSKDDFFKDWALVGVPDSRYRQEADELPIGTCVQGVMVDFGTPGFRGQPILAIANATGSSAPRTNVARSALEDTPERTQTISKFYELFAGQVADEVNRLVREEKYSLSWAVWQAPFIAAAYASTRNAVTDRDPFLDSLSKIPLFLVEVDGERKALSVDELAHLNEVWLIEAPLLRSIESLLRETQSEVTARSIIELTHGKDWLPTGDIVSSGATSQLVLEILQRKFELKELRAMVSERRLDVRLGLTGTDASWLGEERLLRQIRRRDPRSASVFAELAHSRRNPRIRKSLWVPLVPVPMLGLDGFGSVEVLNAIYVLPGQKIGERIVELYREDTLDSLVRAAIHFEAINMLRTRGSMSVEVKLAALQRFLQQLGEALEAKLIDSDSVSEAVRESEFRNFDPLAWLSRDGDLLDLEV